MGPADLSVLVQQGSAQSALLDAHVTLHLTQVRATGIVELVSPAKHENATNKLLYAARINLPSAGTWRMLVRVESAKADAEITGRVSVDGPQPPLLTYWPYFAVVPLVVILFAINQMLKTRRRARA